MTGRHFSMLPLVPCLLAMRTMSAHENDGRTTSTTVPAGRYLGCWPMSADGLPCTARDVALLDVTNELHNWVIPSVCAPRPACFLSVHGGTATRMPCNTDAPQYQFHLSHAEWGCHARPLVWAPLGFSGPLLRSHRNRPGRHGSPALPSPPQVWRHATARCGSSPTCACGTARSTLCKDCALRGRNHWLQPVTAWLCPCRCWARPTAARPALRPWQCLPTRCRRPCSRRCSRGVRAVPSWSTAHT